MFYEKCKKERIEEEERIRLKNLEEEQKKLAEELAKEGNENEEELETKTNDNIDENNDEDVVVEDEKLEQNIESEETKDADSDRKSSSELHSKVSPITVVSAPLTYPSVLIPTQCSQSNFPQSTTTDTEKNIGINFAEFEGDASDPFDSVALKSINDMEELAKVLQPSSISEKSNGYGQFSSGRQLNGIYPNNVVYGNPYPVYTPRPFYNHYEKATQPNVHVNACSKVTQPSSYYQSTACHSNSQPRYSYNCNVNNTRVAPPLPITATGSQNINSNPITEPARLVPSAIPKRQDLEDFYSRYYSNQKVTTSTSGVRSGHTTPTFSTFGSLRSSTSVPDLTTSADDFEVSQIVSSSPNDRLYVKSPASNPSSRPSSTVGIEVSNKN